MDRYEFKLPTPEIGMPVATQMKRDVEEIACCPALVCCHGRPVGPARPGDSAEPHRSFRVLEGEAQVAFLERTGRRDEARGAGEEDRVRVADSERA